MKLIFLFLSSFLYSTLSWANSEIEIPETHVNLQKDLSNILETQGLTGITWHTIDEVGAQSGGLGFANIANGQPMIDTTPVHVGSVAKTLFAIGMLRLLEKTDLSLDSEVASLFSTQIIDNPWRDSSPVRVRHLLEHTAGLNNLYIWQFLNSKPTEDTPLRDALFAHKTSLLKIRSKPGTQYSYSNIGYTLLALIIEEVSGQRYEDFLDREVLSALGMSNSTFHFTHQKQSATIPLAMGYLEKNREIQALPTYLRPAGQFTTTAKDMLALSKLLLTNGTLDNEQYIKPDLMKQLAEPSTTYAAMHGLKVGHGLALAIRDRHGALGMCHPGTTFGFRANLCLFPDQQKAFFYSINTDSETANYELLNLAFIRALNLTDTAAVRQKTKSAEIQPQKIEGFYQYSPNNMAEFAWLDTVFGIHHLSLSGNSWLLRSVQNSDRVLHQVNSSLFRATDRTSPSHVVFEVDGQQFLSDGLNTFKKVSVLTVVFYWASLLLGLIGFLYIFLVPFVRLVLKSSNGNKYLLWPWYNILLFALPAFAFTQQSFIQFGELTLASGLLTVVSLLLPISLTISIVQMGRYCRKSRVVVSDMVSSVLALQFILMLVYWQTLPIKFWIYH